VHAGLAKRCRKYTQAFCGSVWPELKVDRDNQDDKQKDKQKDIKQTQTNLSANEQVNKKKGTTNQAAIQGAHQKKEDRSN